MVRNWQARVEQADVRRKQAKQKKQFSEDKKLWKQWINDCIKNQLDQNIQPLQQLLVVTDSAINHVAAKNLDRNDNNDTKHYIHIWTDARPSADNNEDAIIQSKNYDQLHDDDDDGDDRSLSKKKKRLKSYSVGDDDDVDNDVSVTQRSSKKEQRSRSNSTGGGILATKKKAHPRSKEAISMEHVSSSLSKRDDEDVCMCRSYFFTGTCSLAKKKNSCRHVHPNSSSDSRPTNRTLYDALNAARMTNQEHQLQKSARAEMVAAERAATINTTIAAAAAMSISSPTSNTTVLSSSSSAAGTSTTTTSTDPVVVIGAMNMVHYIKVPILFDHCSNDDSETIMLPSEQISKVLFEQSLFLGNIVYMSMNGVLIFDRYQDGMIYSNDEFLHAVFGEQAVDNVVLCKRDRCSKNPEDVELLVHMPTTILEGISSFLLDESIVSMTQVCRFWHEEIGHPNAPLWKILLDRREWPYSNVCIDQDQDQHTDTYSYREQFQQHYSVIRDMRALNKGFEACITRSHIVKNSLCNADVSVYDYSSRQNAPAGLCVGIEVWSPRRILVAYEHDCTVRLYESSHKITAGGVLTNEKICRELICYCINPYRNTKKKNCMIAHIVLDEKNVTTLCSVYNSETEILVTISRDDFLLGQSDGGFPDNENSYDNNPMQSLQVFNLTDEILKYMLREDNDSPPIFDNLTEEDIPIRFSSISDSASSCGPGLVLVATNMYLKEANGESSEYLDARVFLISTTKRQIVWSHSCDPLFEHSAFFVMGLIANATSVRRDNGRTISRSVLFGVASGGRSERIIVGKIDLSGTVSAINILESVPSNLPVIESDERWSKNLSVKQQMVVTTDEIIVADVWFKQDEYGFWLSIRTIIWFHPNTHVASGEPVSYLELSEKLIVRQLSYVRNQYLVVMCDELVKFPDELYNEEGQSGIQVSIVVHIPSRREVGRITWKGIFGHPFPYMVSWGQETLGLAMSVGILMTGNDVRYHGNGNDNEDMFGNQDSQMDSHQLELLTRKKKKKAVRSKKDSFRTHNGDRCY